jgi:two-component system chemotaxis response regulator CheB
MARPLYVLVVDDSAVVRETLRQLLSQEPGFEVETAADPLLALPKMARRPPDVVVLDLEMPRMDGFTFLRKLMAEQPPTPVVICSGHTGRGSEAALRALHEGAVEVIRTP